MKMLMIRRVQLYSPEAPEERNPPYLNRVNKKQIKIKKLPKIPQKEAKTRIQNHKHLDRSLHRDSQDQLMLEHQRQLNQSSLSLYFHRERRNQIQSN